MAQNVAYLFVVGLLALCALAAVVVLAQFLRSIGASQYERVEKLFTPAERSFFGVLEQVFGNDYRVFGKVRLADVIKPRKGLSGSARMSAGNRIDRKHVDFVLCNMKTLEVLGVIELDDSSHKRASSRNGDAIKDKALAAAGVPIVRITAQRAYSPSEIRGLILERLNPVATN